MDNVEETPVVKQKPSGEKIAATVGEIAAVVHAAFVVKRWIKLGLVAYNNYNAAK